MRALAAQTGTARPAASVRSLSRSAGSAGFTSQHASARRRTLRVSAAQQGSEEGLGAQIGRIAKKIQGALPIVGLLSRLASPEGGFDEVVGCPAAAPPLLEAAERRRQLLTTGARCVVGAPCCAGLP